jgi:HSP20 family molecular chaperone IbpA
MFRKPKKKRSFFEKLTGSMPVDEFDDLDIDEDEDDDNEKEEILSSRKENKKTKRSSHFIDNEEGEEDLMEEELNGQLAVDVINEDNAIVIKAMLAGVKPTDIDVDISRDMITIHGEREESQEIEAKNYYHRELYWGGFSRNILLPEEVDVDAAEATEKYGLLTIRLPKLDKSRKAKVQVKSR